MARYYVRAEGMTCMSPFQTAAEAHVWALINITAMGALYEVMRVQAEGVH